VGSAHRLWGRLLPSARVGRAHNTAASVCSRPRRWAVPTLRLLRAAERDACSIPRHELLSHIPQ
jgi:hypothetical protein